MDILDFIVFFFYVFVLNALFALRRKRYTDPVLRMYHKQAFWIKVCSSLAFSLFVVYISRGDTTALFYPEGHNIYKMILDGNASPNMLVMDPRDFDETLLYDSYNLGYLKIESNFLVTRIVAFLSFFTFGKFLAINLFFSLAAFTGAWRLYLFFYEQYPRLHKQFAIGILYLPTFIFWSSGILKDPLCAGALGWFTYSFYHIFYKRKNVILDISIALASAYLIVILKVYIIISYAPFFILFLILKNVELIKSRFARISLVVGFLAGSIVGFNQLADDTERALGSFASKGLSSSIVTYQANYANQKTDESSAFSLGVEYDGSIRSLLRMAPAAIIATLFRPFIWESKKISTLISSLESLVMILFTLYVIRKTGIRNFFVTILKNPIIIYCLLFSLTFALFVGATTLNFGTLVRYKIPAMPFYVIGLFLILYFGNKKGPKVVPDL